MSELSALAGSEGYGACDDEGGWGPPQQASKPSGSAKAVIGQFPASVMTLALLAGYSQPHKKRIDAIKIAYLPS